jgi:hypothetical protein
MNFALVRRQLCPDDIRVVALYIPSALPFRDSSDVLPLKLRWILRWHKRPATQLAALIRQIDRTKHADSKRRLASWIESVVTIDRADVLRTLRLLGLAPFIADHMREAIAQMFVTLCPRVTRELAKWGKSWYEIYCGKPTAIGTVAQRHEYYRIRRYVYKMAHWSYLTRAERNYTDPE